MVIRKNKNFSEIEENTLVITNIIANNKKK